MNEWKEYLEVAKGIGIFMVVRVHVSDPISSYIEQFHMPFFLCFWNAISSDRKICKEYVFRKCKGLPLPSRGWNLIFFPIFFVLHYWENRSIAGFFSGLQKFQFSDRELVEQITENTYLQYFIDQC